MLKRSYSIVIISKDRRQMLENCVSLIRKYVAGIQIIIIESTNEEQPIVGENIKYIAVGEKDSGFSKQRNFGLENSDGDYVIFIDDDCEVTENWFDNLVRPVEDDSNLIGVLGAVFPLNPGMIGFCEGVLGHPAGGFRTHHINDGKDISISQISTCNSVIKKKVIAEVKGFSLNKIDGGEDSDLSFKIKQQFGSNQFKYSSEALVYHLPRNALLKIIPWYFKRGKASADLFKGKISPLKYEIRTSILLKLFPFILTGILFKTILIPFSFLLVLYVVYLMKYKFMWKYFSYYNFNVFKCYATYLLFPVIKVISDIMFDLGRLLRLLKIL